MDGGYASKIHISNVLITGPLVVTPTLYMSDGTPYQLQPVRVPVAGTYEINVNDALYAAPPAVADHLSDYGSASLSYQHESAGHLLAFMEIIDVGPSVIFSEPFAGIDEGPEGEQNFEGLWWRHTPEVHGFVSLSNVTSEPMQVSFQPTGSSGTALAAGAVTLPAHATQMLDLDSLVSGLPQAENQAGGLRVQYTGRKRALMLGGGLLQEGIGYSADAPFWARNADASSAATAITYASVGIMVGKPHPGMGFPPSLRFTPYAVLRNTTSRPLALSLQMFYMAGGVGGSSPLSLTLPAQQLKPYETLRLDLPAMLANAGLANFDGDINLTFSLTGRGGDLVLTTGSVDQTGNFVFPVLPEAIGRSFGKGISHWTVANGLDSMYTLWNPLDTAQDFLMTLHYGDGSGQYVKAIHLAGKASVTIDVGMLLTEHEPDVNGDLIPAYVQEGTVTFSNPKGRAEWMTLAACGAFYNPRKGTCAMFWTYCYGYDGFDVELNPWSVAAQGRTQMHAWATYADGSKDDFAGSSTWSSSNTPVATVGSSTALVSGVSPGSATLYAQYPQLPAYTGELCVYGEIMPCPEANPDVGSGGGVTPTVSVGCSNLHLALGSTSAGSPGPYPGTNTTTCTATVNPSGGSVAWSVNGSTVTLSPSGTTATVTAANPSSSWGDTLITAKYTYGTSAPVSATTNPGLTVHQPTSLAVLTGSGYVPGGTNYPGLACVGSYQCPGSNYGSSPCKYGSNDTCSFNAYLYQRLYTVMDQLNPANQFTEVGISQAYVVETFTNIKSNFCNPVIKPNNPVTTTPGDSFSEADSCCLSGQPTGCYLSDTQTITVNGFPLRVEAITLACTAVTLSP